MSNSLHKRIKLRRVCRKCGARLVPKESINKLVCQKCGWELKLFREETEDDHIFQSQDYLRKTHTSQEKEKEKSDKD